MDELQVKIFQWTQLDKQLKEINKQSSEIRKKKEELQKNICPIIKDNQLESNIFSIPSLQANVSLKEQRTSESISYKFLEEKFNEYFKKVEEGQQLLQYIKDNRKKEVNYILKSMDTKG
jgi:hypothetical protein